MNTITQWHENLIIADADYMDKVAFDMTVYFERAINRRIPKADLARWIECVALDGGLKPGDNETQVVLVADTKSSAMENFTPSSFKEELDSKAFKGNLGEFSFTVVPSNEIVSKTQLINDILGAACVRQEVKRIMVVPDAEDGVTYEKLSSSLDHIDDDTKRITLFAMKPMTGGNFRQHILGYSMLAALGVKASELKD